MTDTAAAKELASFVERIEAQNVRISDETEARKEIYDELKWRGYCAKAVREIVRLRKLAADERAEREAVLELYCSALGM